jgi:uncharacterized protein YndB with AHSA1/START domain
VTLDPSTDLKLERVVDAPRDLLWLCWTTPEHIKNFFIPVPHKVKCDLDLRVGGRFNTVFEVDGQRMDNKGVFLEIDPGRKLVFTDGYTEDWKPAEKPFMTAILLLEDAGEGKPAIRRLRAIHRQKFVNSMNKWASTKGGDCAGSAGGVGAETVVLRTPSPTGEGESVMRVSDTHPQYHPR